MTSNNEINIRIPEESKDQTSQEVVTRPVTASQEIPNISSIDLSPDLERKIEILKNDILRLKEENDELKRKNSVKLIRYFFYEFIPDYAGPIRCLVQLGNGNIATTTEDGSITIWKRLPADDLEKEKFIEIKTLTYYESPILSLIELDNGLLVSGCEDGRINIYGKIHIYDNDSDEIETLAGHGGKVRCLLELSSNLVASGSEDCTILLWGKRTLDNKYDIVVTLKGHEASVNAIIQLDEDHLASGSSDEKIRIWLLTDVTCIMILEGHTSSVTSLLKLSSGDFVSGSGDRSIKVWSKSKQYECVQTLTGHLDEVTALVQLSDGEIASTSKDKRLRIWSPASDKFDLTKVIEVLHEDIYSVAVLNNGKIAIGSSKVMFITIFE